MRLWRSFRCLKLPKALQGFGFTVLKTTCSGHLGVDLGCMLEGFEVIEA